MKLTKIKLINWHLFTDNVINVNNNLLITGENGNGKSTLIDAIFYVLSGGDEKHFNCAANVESKRTLISYMRGKLGFENKEFLRNEPNIVTHIALEFYDSIENEWHILGCVISIENSANPRAKFYIAMNSKIDDISFVLEDKGVLDFDYFKTSNAQIDITDLEKTNGGKKGYQVKRAKIAQFLNINNNEKYYELLTKAIAFKPINTNVSDFVFEFLLKEDDIPLSNLSTDLANYREVLEKVNTEKAKIEYLETFISKAEQYVGYKKDIEYLSVLRKESDVKSIQLEIDRITKKITNLNQRMQNTDLELENYKSKLKQIEIEIDSYESRGEFKGINEKKASLNELKKQKGQLDEKIEKVESDLTFEMELMAKVGLQYDFLKDIKVGNIALLNQHINEYLNDLAKTRKRLSISLSDREKDKEKSEGTINDYVKALSLIKQGKNEYKNNVTDLIAIIKAQLKQKYGKEIPVLPLCECLEIVDKEWTNAIEGYLNTQRFDLIIAPEYFFEASEIYEKYCNKYHLYDVGVVNTGVIQDGKVLDNSLYTKIKVLNPYANGICQRLLGRVLCVDSVYDFKPHQTCITKTCMRYVNDTTRAINPEVYKIPFIGEDSIIKRKTILEEMLEDENAKLNQIRKEIHELDITYITLDKSKIRNEEIDNYWAKLKLLEQNIADLQNDINVLSQNKDIMQLMGKYNELLNQQKDINTKIAEMNVERKSISNDLQEQEKEKYYKLNKLKEAEQDYTEVYESISDIEDFKGFKSLLESSEIDLAKEIDKRTRTINSIQDAIKSGMREYSKEYNANLSAEIECINDYIIEYNKIKGRELANSEAVAAEAFRTAQDVFYENFISKLSDRFKFVRDELDRINANLRLHPFGRDEETYEFVKQDSGDQEMREYVRIITSGKDMIQKDLFTERLDSKDREIMQGLFDKLVAINDSTQAAKDLHKYLDYRQYFNYDILIKNKNNDKTYFSKINKEKSGGEMQTPFYVIIGACFDELIKHDERLSGACIVAFDEAFNNMDEPRIITLMNYYKKLNIQLIIVVPTNHSKDIMPYVDTVVSLKKENNYIYETYLYNRQV
jgi:uncharacterized protein YPO0396